MTLKYLLQAKKEEDHQNVKKRVNSIEIFICCIFMCKKHFLLMYFLLNKTLCYLYKGGINQKINLYLGNSCNKHVKLTKKSSCLSCKTLVQSVLIIFPSAYFFIFNFMPTFK